jgi:hypothetical protein
MLSSIVHVHCCQYSVLSAISKAKLKKHEDRVIGIHIRIRVIRVTPDLDELRRHRPTNIINTTMNKDHLTALIR